MEIEQLRTLGLTKGEVKVYSAILNLGISSINNIHEKTGLERRAIYDIINKLIEKGIISYNVEKGKRTYQCASPNKLKEELSLKRKELDNFEKVLPTIEEIYKSSKPKINTENFRGKEGIKSVWNDMLDYPELRWIGSGNYVPKKLPEFFENWNKRRRDKKIDSYHLFRNEIRKELIKNAGFAKFLPEEFSVNPAVICVYGNKVVNFLFGEELFAFVIESKELSENYKKYHKYLWDKIAKN